MFFVRVGIVLIIYVVITGPVPASKAATQPRIAVLELRLAIVAHLAKLGLLLVLQIKASAGVLAVRLATLVERIILLFTQAINLVVKIAFQFTTWVCWPKIARGKLTRRDQHEGRDYKGIAYPLFIHRASPGNFIFNSRPG